MKQCWLKPTEIELLDGNVYTFRRLSYGSPVALDLIDAIEGDKSTGDTMRTMVAAVRESLSWDQDHVIIDELLTSGALPLALNEDDENGELTKDVLAACSGISKATTPGKKRASSRKGSKR